MKTDNKTIAMIESIPSFDTYSKYSHTLARMFKHSSLKNLLHSLKHPRHFNNKEFSQFIQSTSPDKRQFDMAAFEKALSSQADLSHNMRSSLLRKRNETDIINNSTNADSNQHPIRNNKRRLPPLNDIPDPCHYNPNYNAIYRKIPSAIISHPSSSSPSSSFVHNKQSTITYDNNNKHSIINTSIISRSPSPKKRKVFDTEISESLPSNNKNALPPIDYFGKNHALRFESYPNRKSIVVPAVNDKVSYLEPVDYSKKENKAVDFKKMKKRGVFDLIYAQQLYTPGLNYYQPKYKVVEKNSPMISFSTRNVPELTKGFKVQKLWRSYDVLTEYQVVKECNEIRKEDMKVKGKEGFKGNGCV